MITPNQKEIDFNKKYQSILSRISECLPKTVYVANKREKKEVVDLIEKESKNCNVFDLNPTAQINISKHQVIMTEQECYFYASNKNRVKKAWNESGKIGVIKYILWINENNKAVNNSNSNAKVGALVGLTLKANIQSFM